MWVWALTFDKLMQDVVLEPVLRMPDFEKSFEVNTDVSDKPLVKSLLRRGTLPLKVKNLKMKNSDIQPMEKR